MHFPEEEKNKEQIFVFEFSQMLNHSSKKRKRKEKK